MSDDLLVRIGRRYGSTGLCMIVVATTILALRWSIISDFDLLSVLITITLLILSIYCSIVLITLMATRIEELQAKLAKVIILAGAMAEAIEDQIDTCDASMDEQIAVKNYRTALAELTSSEAANGEVKGGKDE